MFHDPCCTRPRIAYPALHGAVSIQLCAQLIPCRVRPCPARPQSLRFHNHLFVISAPFPSSPHDPRHLREGGGTAFCHCRFVVMLQAGKTFPDALRIRPCNLGCSIPAAHGPRLPSPLSAVPAQYTSPL